MGSIPIDVWEHEAVVHHYGRLFGRLHGLNQLHLDRQVPGHRATLDVGEVNGQTVQLAAVLEVADARLFEGKLVHVVDLVLVEALRED